MKYRSTRDNNIIKDDKIALLQGLSEDGGLFVLENLSDKKINLENLIDKSYTEIAFEVLKLFFSFDEDVYKRQSYCWTIYDGSKSIIIWW